MFVRLELDDGSKHEWGWESNVVPVVGDYVWLYYERPNEEPTGDGFLEAVVVKRQVLVADDNEIWITARSNERVPDGYIADSPAWPSLEESIRKEQLARDLEEIRNRP